MHSLMRANSSPDITFGTKLGLQVAAGEDESNIEGIRLDWQLSRFSLA